MKTNITVVTYNRLNLTKICLNSLLSLTEGDFCVNVVDNASNDGTWDYLRETARNDSRVKPIRLVRNMGIAIAANLGWSQDERLPYVKLDNDVEITSPDWLKILLEYSGANPELGMVAYKFLDRHASQSGCLVSSRMPFELYGTTGGACVLIPPHVHERLGFWNEDYGKYGYEDLEYGERCHIANLLTGYVPFEDRTRHLGYVAPLPEYEQSKQKVVDSDFYGERMYYINKLLFENKVRELYVKRKMLPVSGTDPVKFRSNPEYRAILQIVSAVQKTVSANRVDDKIVCDLSLWKKPEHGEEKHEN